MSILSAPYFHDEEAAYKFVEARLWPNGPVCPRCKGTERISKMDGKSTRIGTYKCYACRKPFTVKVGTIFESSHVKMHLWLQAIYLIASSKKGISSNQLHRTLGVTLKTAWFLSHRIREAMRAPYEGKIGGGGQYVEVDETFFGKAPGKENKGAGYDHKEKILSLVERGGQARSFHVKRVNADTLGPIIKEQIFEDSAVMTDEAGYYKNAKLGEHFAGHDTVNHGIGEYVRGSIHTNSIEGFFSILKRGMKGVYQHCGSNHLKRYLAEFDFRYTERVANGVDDAQRADKLLQGVVGKRLTYKTPY